MSKREKQIVWGLLFTAMIITSTGWSTEVRSQEKYPTRPIEIIGPYSPGGMNDATARITADYLKKKWKVPVNVVNKPGGNTIPANIEMYRAAPDGYTVLCDQVESSIMLEITAPNLPFKVFSRTWIGVAQLGAMMFVIPSTSPHKSLNDVIAEIKRDPGNFTWTSYGGTGAADTCFRQLFKAIGVDVRKTKPVACEGGAKCAALIAGGHVKMGAIGTAGSVGSLDAGLIKPLAMIGMRYPGFPELLSTTELGYPTVNYVGWMGFSGPPKMPSHIVDIWNRELKEMNADPDVLSRYRSVKGHSVYISSVQMKELATKTMQALTEVYTPPKK